MHRDATRRATPADVDRWCAGLRHGLQDLVGVQAPPHPALEAGRGGDQALQVAPVHPRVGDRFGERLDGQLQLWLVRELAPAVRSDAQDVDRPHERTSCVVGENL